VAARFICHPEDCSWQDPLVTAWAKAHPKEVARGTSATEWEALEKAHKKEVMDKIEKMSNSSRSAWDYLNKNYKDLFGDEEKAK